MSILSDAIDPIISDYKTVIAKLLLVPVPQPMAQYHMDLINGISSLLSVSESLRKHRSACSYHSVLELISIGRNFHRWSFT